MWKMGNVDVVSGPEPLRRARVSQIVDSAAVTGKTRIVCENAEEALEVLDSLSWSLLLVHVKNFDTYPTSSQKPLRSSLESTEHDVLIEADKLTKAQEGALPERARRQKINSSGQSYRRALEDCARANNLELDPEALDYLTRQAGPAAAVSAITALGSARITPATLAHVRALAVNDANSGLPWLLLEAIEAGNEQAIKDHSEALETPALTAYLGKRLVAAACLSEKAQTNLELHTGGLTDAARKQAEHWSRLHTQEALREAISACAAADQLAKSGYSDEALSLAISAYSKLLRSRAKTM